MATKKLVKNLALLLITTSLLSTWWIVPNVSYYLLSPTTELLQGANAQSWSWTHIRASFLNLFWLNGGWGWRAEYFPYYNFYSDNAILSFLLFVPFLLASTVLIFKDKKLKLNAYLMLIILLFIFLAKGLHEPLSFVNLFLYDHVPYMSMFREPVSKFTLIMIPFLALLIGYATNKIAKTLTHHRLKHSTICSKLFVISVILIFSISNFPMFTNPIETKTEQIPYSTYVKIPQYWYETDEWLINKTGNYKILVTPFNDHYQVPYVWGYYGTDSFLERLIQKPIISPAYVYSYKVNPSTAMLISQLHDALKYNRTEESETIMSLLNVKYILQRNDLDYEHMASTNRDIVIPEQMRNFLSNQPNITLVKTIGKLDIYEYTRAQQYIHIFKYKQPQEYDIEITNKTVLNLQWNFNSTNQLDDWKNTTSERQFGTTCKLHLDNSTLKFELWNSTWGWKTITSPLITARYEAKYNFRLDIKGENAHEVHIKILEYDKEMELTHSEYVFYVSDGAFDWKNIQIEYLPEIENTTFLQIQIWNGHETDKPLPNTIWIDNIEILGFITELNLAKIQEALETSIDNSPARIVEYKKLNPTKLTVKINASEPFILAINEAHDPNWIAHLDGGRSSSVPIFSVMNGFQVNQTGYLEMVIEYEPQKWFYYGSMISVTTFIACLVYTIYRWNKAKIVWKRIRITIKSHLTSALW